VPLALLGAHVVVTGASRGIGAALAGELAGRGARVTLVARSEMPLKALAAEIGGVAVVADLADPSHLDGLVARIEAGAGPVDVLINNAAVAVVNRLVDQSADDIRQSFALNCVAPAELCRQVLPGMLARGRGRPQVLDARPVEHAGAPHQPVHGPALGQQLLKCNDNDVSRHPQFVC